MVAVAVSASTGTLGSSSRSLCSRRYDGRNLIRLVETTRIREERAELAAVAEPGQIAIRV